MVNHVSPAPRATAVRDDHGSRFHLVDLDLHRDNVGVTSSSATGYGAFNVWGNSLPAEELPSGRAIQVEDVPFTFPATGGGRPDNVRCAGQHITVEPGQYDWLYLLTAAERRVEDEIAFHYADGAVDFEPLRVSDFWAAPAVFGETSAFTTLTMHYPYHVQANVSAMVWCQRVPLVRGAALAAMRLPRNPAVHIFAATFVLRKGHHR
ncbi:hypothetical protein KIPE111705_05125 [Kibdelosporangium persicum]|uniref:Uncharacterized protein n=1 Tax=Kibdelosporangium persicum TaxID=2698649 RepID=A0ABX2FHI6_9PSEU|nr:hypothetical protein [Kibdelosporangium persicum]NRN70855.1 hypothetical protein [Kibdelosporangium persicum]